MLAGTKKPPGTIDFPFLNNNYVCSQQSKPSTLFIRSNIHSAIVKPESQVQSVVLDPIPNQSKSKSNWDWGDNKITWATPHPTPPPPPTHNF